MPGNIFGGGGMFGKPIPLGNQARPGIPVVGQGQPGVVKPLGVVAPGPIPQGHAMGPNGPVPLGDKKDCPICRG